MMANDSVCREMASRHLVLEILDVLNQAFASFAFSAGVGEHDIVADTLLEQTFPLIRLHNAKRAHTSVPKRFMNVLEGVCHMRHEGSKQGLYRQMKINQLGQAVCDALEKRAHSIVRRSDAISYMLLLRA